MELQGKKKLSQNYSTDEMRRISDALSRSEHALEKTIGEMMRVELKKRQ